jgi:cyclophilin family peptidyl-prolyl cis-trans isomerase
LLEAIVEQGGREIAWFLERLLTDYDPGIASGASAALTGLTGKAARPAPRLLPRPPPPSALELQERLVARVDLETGGSFDIVFDKEQATLAYTRFARLARAQYFDGLTFHRVAPNFVIQGGSPRANEYAGDAFFMRDELTTTTHATGTVGTSTRGRDTGDAQFFINLVDNRTLEFEYTVFGSVANPRGGADVESILEGTEIRRIRMVPPVPPLR